MPNSGGNGPGGNGHVTVTDFHACTDMIVVSGGDGKTNWTKRSFPLFRLLIRTTRIFGCSSTLTKLATRTRLDKLNSGGSVTGIINKAVQGPDDKAKDLLKGSYSGVDLDKVYVVQHDMTAISRIAGIFLLIAGVVLFAASVFLLKKMPAANSNRACRSGQREILTASSTRRSEAHSVGKSIRDGRKPTGDHGTIILGETMNHRSSRNFRPRGSTCQPEHGPGDPYAS